MISTNRATFVLLPGAWMGAWIWADVAEVLRARGHDVHALTLTGLEADAGRPPTDIRLRTHVEDVIAHIVAHGLTDVTLVGHSYSGVVAGQVADALPGPVSSVAFVEAILPIDGQSMLESGGNDVEAETQLIRNNGGMWPPPTAEDLRHERHLGERQRKFLLDRFVDHPGRTVADPAIMTQCALDIPCTFIGSAVPKVARISAFRRMQHTRLDAGHWPMLTKPEELTAALINA